MVLWAVNYISSSVLKWFADILIPCSNILGPSELLSSDWQDGISGIKKNRIDLIHKSLAE